MLRHAAVIFLHFCRATPSRWRLIGFCSFDAGNENYLFNSAMLGDCAADISDQTRWSGNYKRPVVIGTVATCRQAVATRCERGIRDFYFIFLAGMWKVYWPNMVFVENGKLVQIMVLNLRKGSPEVFLYFLCSPEEGMLTKFGLYWNGRPFSYNGFNENLW